MAFGDRFSSQEVDDTFDACEIDDDGMIVFAELIAMLTGKTGEEEEGGEAAAYSLLLKRTRCSLLMNPLSLLSSLLIKGIKIPMLEGRVFPE